MAYQELLGSGTTGLDFTLCGLYDTIGGTNLWAWTGINAHGYYWTSEYSKYVKFTTHGNYVEIEPSSPIDRFFHACRCVKD